MCTYTYISIAVCVFSADQVYYLLSTDKLRGLLMDYINTVISDVTPAPSPEKGRSTLTSTSSAHQHSGGTDNCTCERTATKHPLSSETTQEQLVTDEESCQALTYGRTFTLQKPIEEYSIYYIGYESLTMSNLVMNYSSCKVHMCMCAVHLRVYSMYIHKYIHMCVCIHNSACTWVSVGHIPYTLLLSWG